MVLYFIFNFKWIAVQLHVAEHSSWIRNNDGNVFIFHFPMARKKNGLEECVSLKASQKLRIHRKGSKRASGWAGRMAAIGLQVYISKSRQQQSNIREGQGMELDSLDEEDEEICCTLTFCFQLPFSSSSIIQLETDRQGGLLKCRKGGTPRFFSLSFYWKWFLDKRNLNIINSPK